MTDAKHRSLDKIFRAAKKESEILGREAHVAELLGPYLKMRPKHAKAWMLFGDALRVLGRNAESLPALTLAFEMAPPEYKAYVAVQIAMLLEKHVSPKDAKHWYMLATEIENASAGWLWILRGANFSALGEYADAIACFETVVTRQAEETDEALLNLGLVYRAMGDYEKAMDFFNKALSLNPNYPEALEAAEGLAGISSTLDLVRDIKGGPYH